MNPYYWNQSPRQTESRLYDLVERYNIDIFDFDYPLFDKEHRSELERKIYEHYKWFRPFTSNPTMFVDRMKQTLNEIMPLMNQRYRSALHKLDPFITESILEKSGTKHGQGRATGYRSGMEQEAGHTEQDENVSRETHDTTGEVDTKGSSNAVGGEDVVTHYDETKDTKQDYNENTTLDTTKDVDSDTKETSSGTSDDTTENTKQIDGNSLTNTTNHSDTVFREDKKHADTPQTDLGSIGNYWSDHTRTDSDTTVDSTGRQDVTTHETTTDNGNKHGTTSGEKDTSTSANETGNQEGSKQAETITHEETENDGTKNTTNFNDVDTFGNEISQGYSETNTKSAGGRTSRDNSRNTITSYENRRLDSDTKYKLRLKGHRNRTPADLIKEYRTALIDVDVEVIRALGSLFNPNL